jgi:hypothetical protein
MGGSRTRYVELTGLCRIVISMTNTRRLGIAALTMTALITGLAHADSELSDHATTTTQGKRHHVRMGLELATIFAVGHQWYWRDNGKPNEVDWQLPHGMAAVEAKLGGTGAWRFDGNAFDINAIGHPMFGMMTTFLARENGYSLGESFLISTLASGTWETFLELREYGSLNDIAMTSPAGLPLGEAAYQMVHHLRETHLELRGGLGVDNGAAFAVMAARADLDLVPAIGAGTFGGGRRVSFAAELPTDDQGLRSVDAGAKATLAGYYHNTNDSSLVVALSSELDYRKQEQRQERDWDLLSVVAFGPSIDYRLRANQLTIDVGADAYLDFGMLKSEGFAGWRAAHPTGVLRNVLEGREHPYYYAAGASLDPHINVTSGGYVAGAKLTGSLFSSIDRADRDQEMITTDLHLTDSDGHGEAWLGYQQRNVSVLLDGRLHRRAGSANDVHAEAAERTAMVTVGYQM